MRHWHYLIHRGMTPKAMQHSHPDGHLWHEHPHKRLFGYGRTKETLRR